MKLFDYISTRLAVIAVAAVTLTSCSGMIYDDEGDCAPYYKVRFEYRMHMEGTPGNPQSYPDAFPHNVNSVTLYAVDAATGKIVWLKHESGDRVLAEGYEMDLPVDPGKYHLMAWCGEGHTTSFTVNESDHINDLHCRMNRGYVSRTGEVAVSKDRLGDLYHGREENLEMPDEQGVHYYTVSLTKDTNTIQILLQQLSGEPMDPDDFDMEITDVNGHLESDNSIRGNEMIYYRPWKAGNSLSDIIYPGSEHSPTELGAVMAEFSVSRLMLDNDPRLTVSRHEDGEELFSIPLKPYMLQFVSDRYSKMDGQEYLDREDEYRMMFFLDSGLRWINSYIYINSFKVILQNVEL